MRLCRQNECPESQTLTGQRALLASLETWLLFETPGSDEGFFLLLQSPASFIRLPPKLTHAHLKLFYLHSNIQTFSKSTGKMFSLRFVNLAVLIFYAWSPFTISGCSVKKSLAGFIGRSPE